MNNLVQRDRTAVWLAWLAVFVVGGVPPLVVFSIQIFHRVQWSALLRIDVPGGLLWIILVGGWSYFGEVRPQLSLRFTEEGIEYYSWFRRVFVSWQEITAIRNVPLTLVTPNRKIGINLIYYRDEESLYNVIRTHAPERLILSSDTR